MPPETRSKRCRTGQMVLNPQTAPRQLISPLTLSRRSQAHLAHVLDALLSGDRFLRALASPGIRAGPLAADRQPAAMTKPAIAGDVLQAQDVLSCLPPQLA